MSYVAQPSRTEPNSWNVILVGKRNEFGEPWVEVPHLTRDEAIAETKRLNERARPASQRK